MESSKLYWKRDFPSIHTLSIVLKIYNLHFKPEIHVFGKTRHDILICVTNYALYIPLLNSGIEIILNNTYVTDTNVTTEYESSTFCRRMLAPSDVMRIPAAISLKSANLLMFTRKMPSYSP